VLQVLQVQHVLQVLQVQHVRHLVFSGSVPEPSGQPWA
jgi:hypothetical protein